MISAYRDHAANERTFLAWIRTGIAVIAFGVVIEKLNLFVLTLTTLKSLDAGHELQFERLSGPIGRYEGLALIILGIALIAVAIARFVHTKRLLDDGETYRIAARAWNSRCRWFWHCLSAGSASFSRSPEHNLKGK